MLTLFLIGVGLEVFFETQFGHRLFLPNARRVTITGQIVDQEGNPVPRSHVVISTRVALIEGNTRCFGVVSDDDGQYEADIHSDEPLSFDISVIAAGPGDLYGGVGNPLTHTSWSTLTSRAEIQLAPLPKVLLSNPNYRYQMFQKSSCPSGLKFLDKGW